MSGLSNYVGLDLSLTASGVGVATVMPDGEWFGYTERHGYKLEKATFDQKVDRIDFVAGAVLNAVDELGVIPDLLAIEEMPYGATGQDTHDRAALWMDVYRGIRKRGIRCVRVNVSTLKIYATGQGNKVTKEEVMLAIAKRYSEVEIEDNNEADAFGLTAIMARLDGHPLEAKLPQTHLRALDKLELPA